MSITISTIKTFGQIYFTCLQCQVSPMQIYLGKKTTTFISIWPVYIILTTIPPHHRAILGCVNADEYGMNFNGNPKYVSFLCIFSIFHKLLSYDNNAIRVCAFDILFLYTYIYIHVSDKFLMPFKIDLYVTLKWLFAVSLEVLYWIFDIIHVIVLLETGTTAWINH